MRNPYSIRAAIGYAITLLVLLWWLPIIGPIIIGYVTGRKAGGPMKGVMAMLVPIFLYFFLIYAVSVGWVNIPPIVQNYFNGSLIGGMANTVFIPYFRETISTALQMGIMAKSYLYYAPSSLFIMLAFAFIGGTMSRQLILERMYGLREVRKNNAMSILQTQEKKKTLIKRKKKAPEDLSKESKFVVHPMDTKKKVPVKEKHYGITFL